MVKLGKMTGFGARVVFALLFGIAAAPLYAFKLNSIDVSGVTLPLGEDIDQKIDALSGQPLTGDLLDRVRATIFQIYSDAGYFARVTFPEQDLTDGVLRVHVSELTLGDVTVTADDDVRLVKDIAAKYLTKALSANEPLSIDDLDRQSTALDSLNGIAAEQSVRFARDKPEVNIEMSLEGTEMFEFSAQVDNFGGEVTGRERASLDVQANSLLHLGDRLVVSAVKSDTLTSGSLDLEVPFGYSGQRAVVGKSKSDYKINLDADKITGASDREWLRLRSSEFLILNSPFTVEAGIERSTSTDRLNDTSTLSTDKSTVERYLSGSLAWVNSASSAAANVSFRLTFGELDLSRIETVQQQDASAGNAHGHYKKLALNVTGQRKLSPQNSLTLTSACQFSSKNLDGMSELELSGPSAVRAYDVAAVSVDQGCFAQTEFVHQRDEQRAFFAFFDAGHGKTHHSLYENWQIDQEDNAFSIFGAGLGARLNIADKFNLSITYAKRLGACSGCTMPQADDRLWAALTATF